jgi:hypothetical protein
MFRGEFEDPEIWEDCRGEYWMPWVQLFLSLINNRHGFFQHYLFEGGRMEQPEASMQIMVAIQSVYYGYLKERNRLPGLG